MELRSMFALSLTREILGQIQEERVRQIEKEGWSLDHDDGHTDRSLARAAAAYAYAASFDDWLRHPKAQGFSEWQGGTFSPLRNLWPPTWGWDWFKPKDRRCDLIRAAALIVAEIERLDRIERAAKDDPFPPSYDHCGSS